MEKNYQRYIDKRGFQVDYPELWEGREEQDVIILYAPQKNNIFEANVTIMLQKLDKGILTVKEYGEVTILQLQEITDDEIISYFKNCKFCNQGGQVLIYELPFKERKNAYLQCWTVKDDYVLLVTYTNDNQYFNDFLDDAKEIVDSISFI